MRQKIYKLYFNGIHEYNMYAKSDMDIIKEVVKTMLVLKEYEEEHCPLFNIYVIREHDDKKILDFYF